MPDHSTFSENRHGRFRESDTFRHLFELVLQRCMSDGLVGGEGFATDASIVKADASRQHHREDDDDWGNSRAVREYLEAMDEDDTQRTRPTRKLSPTDPAASYTAAPGGPTFYAYSTNYLIDTDHGIIVDVEPSTTNRAQEAESTKTMIERVEDRLGIKPQRLSGRWHRANTWLQEDAPATKESGDAVCTHETHTETRPSTLTWYERCT